MSETDPWQTVKRYQRHVGGTFLSPVGRWCFWHEVDAARATEAAQHQQEKDTLRTMATRLTCWRCGTAAYQPNERCDSHMSWTDRLQTEVEHHNAWRKRADEAEARLAAVEAERDLARCQLADIAAGGSKSAKVKALVKKVSTASLIGNPTSAPSNPDTLTVIDQLRGVVLQTKHGEPGLSGRRSLTLAVLVGR